jgi:hypothetical protein
MAAVVRIKPRFVSPVGYEEVDVCELTEDVSAGDLLEFTGVVNDNQALMRKLPAAADAEADGIALKDGFAGQRGFDFGVVLEMDGFSGLTPGDAIHSSSAVAGGLDTTVNGTALPIGKAIRTSRIRFHLR